MVAPVILAGARVVAGSASKKVGRVARKGKALASRPELVRKVRARERRKDRSQKPMTGADRSTQQRRLRSILGRVRGKAWKDNSGKKAAADKIKVSAAAYFVSLATACAIPIQISFGLISLLGLGAQSWFEDFMWGVFSFASSVFPGWFFFASGYAVVVLIGIFSLGFGASVFLLRGINCFSGGRLKWFIVCFIGYLVPGLNLLPWTIFWCIGLVKSS